jgi:hypothetical protein
MSIKLKLNTNFDGPRTGAKMMDENLNPHIFVTIPVNNDKKTPPLPLILLSPPKQPNMSPIPSHHSRRATSPLPE